MVLPIIIEISGWLGLCLGLSYRIPQIWKIYKTNSARDLSMYTIWLQNSSLIAYTVYGFGRDDLVYIISSVINLSQNLVLMGMKLYLDRKEFAIVPLNSPLTSPINNEQAPLPLQEIRIEENK